jgi:hypothetical protein
MGRNGQLNGNGVAQERVVVVDGKASTDFAPWAAYWDVDGDEKRAAYRKRWATPDGGTALLLRSAPTKSDAEPVHLVCCVDGDAALCGTDVSGHPWSGSETSCVVCCDLEMAKACPRFGRCRLRHRLLGRWGWRWGLEGE